MSSIEVDRIIEEEFKNHNEVSKFKVMKFKSTKDKETISKPAKGHKRNRSNSHTDFTLIEEEMKRIGIIVEDADLKATEDILRIKRNS
jgi:hypothetical protein